MQRCTVEVTSTALTDCLLRSRDPEVTAMAAAEEIKARWAFSEARSERWGNRFAKVLAHKLVALANSGAPFSAVQPDEWSSLITALETVRPKDFIDKVDRFGAPEYKLSDWGVSDLLNSTTLPTFGAVKYFQFLALPPNGPNDPRALSHGIPEHLHRAPSECPIAIYVEGAHRLIDGYLRSILWLRNPTAPLSVWTPKRD